MRRMAPYAYENGYDAPRHVSVNPRRVSDMMHKTPGLTQPGSKGFTHMLMQFGQFLDHDITLTPQAGMSVQRDILSTHQSYKNTFSWVVHCVFVCV